MYLNARAAAAEESSDVLMPLVRTSTSGGKIACSTGAAFIHFEYAPMVEQTEEFHILEEKEFNKYQYMVKSMNQTRGIL